MNFYSQMKTISILWLVLVAVSTNPVFAKERNYLKEAEIAFKNGNYKDAGELYRAAYVVDGIDTKNKRILCAECQKHITQLQKYQEQGDMENVALTMKLLLKLNPEDRNAKTFLKNYVPSTTDIAIPFASGYIEKVFIDNAEHFLLFYINPEMTEMTYPDAIKVCNELKAGNGSGWRLPAADELQYYFRDYPSEKGTFYWVGYKGVLLNDKSIEHYEQNTNSRYNPCIDGNSLVVHPYKVNSHGDIVVGELKKHRFIPVKTVD